MRSLLSKFLLLAALGAATWLIVLWRWYAMQRVVSVEDVALYLLALPLGLFAFVLAMRWAVLRGAASAQAAAEAAASARTAGSVPATQPAAPPAWPLLGAWVNTPAGADLEALRTALAEGAPRPAPDARLRDQDGLPLLSARIPALDVPAIEATLAATGMPPGKASPAVLRALAALAPLIEQAAEPWLLATDATATPQTAAPRLQVLVHWPAAWSAAESEAAQAWLQERLRALAADAQPSRPWALRNVPDGGVALLREAIGHLEALQSEKQDGLVLALACHSDLDDDAVQRLEREQQLYAFARRPRGVMPGEAAAALLLSGWAPSAAAAPDAPGVALRGFQAACSETDKAQLPALLSQSLAAAGLEAAGVAALVGDAPQHADAAMALYALAQDSLAHLDLETGVRLMGTLCGHTGAVAPLLALAAAWGECAETGQPALAVSVMDEPWRMAAVVVRNPAPTDRA